VDLLNVVASLQSKLQLADAAARLAEYTSTLAELAQPVDETCAEIQKRLDDAACLLNADGRLYGEYGGQMARIRQAWRKSGLQHGAAVLGAGAPLTADELAQISQLSADMTVALRSLVYYCEQLALPQVVKTAGGTPGLPRSTFARPAGRCRRADWTHPANLARLVGKLGLTTGYSAAGVTRRRESLLDGVPGDDIAGHCLAVSIQLRNSVAQSVCVRARRRSCACSDRRVEAGSLRSTSLLGHARQRVTAHVSRLDLRKLRVIGCFPTYLRGSIDPH
jgi:hypothetical protein